MDVCYAGVFRVFVVRQMFVIIYTVKFSLKSHLVVFCDIDRKRKEKTLCFCAVQGIYVMISMILSCLFLLKLGLTVCY